jgi:hypothetical protein
MKHRSTRLSTSLSLLALACGTPPGPAAPGPAPVSATPGAVPAAAPSTAAPAPASSATPEQPKPDQPSPFSVVAIRASGALQLFPMGGTVFVGDTTSYLAEARGDGLVERPDLLGKLHLTSDQYMERLFGTWPDDVWAVVTTPGGCEPGTASLVRWSKDKWTPTQKVSGTYFGAAPWQKGSVLLLGGFYAEVGFSVAAGRAGTKTPKLPGPNRDDANDGADGFVPELMAALPSGEVFVVGSDGSGLKQVARWTPQSQAPKLDPVPDCGGKGAGHSIDGILARSGTEAYLFGSQQVDKGLTGLLVRFDGAAYQCQKIPPSRSVVKIAWGGDGSLWSVLQHQDDSPRLWHRTADGQWHELGMPKYVPQPGAQPQLFEPTDISVTGSEDIWLSGLLNGDTVAIAHNRPSSTVTTIPPEEESRLAREEYEPPRPATRACETIFAKLYTLSKTAPPNFDFPLTREALKGHREFSGLDFIEAESLGRRFFGVMARNFDEGVKLVDVIRKGVKGSSPVLLCRKPYHVTRHIRFDLATGKMLPEPVGAASP